jgi:hypothetical protein
MGQIIFAQPGSNRAEMRLLRIVPPGPNHIPTHPYLTDCIEVICSSKIVCVRNTSQNVLIVFQVKSQCRCDVVGYNVPHLGGGYRMFGR